MDGFCELCRRRPSTVELLLRRGIALCEDCGDYLCPDCRHPAVAPTGATARQLKGGIAAVGLASAAATVVALTLLATALAYPILFRPAPSGGVLDAVETPASTAGGVGPAPSSSAIGVAASTTPASSSPEALASPVVGSSPAASPAPRSTGGVANAAREPVIRTWTGPYGEARAQVILPVRNTGPSWLQLPRSRSTYRILDATGREVESGVFTASLPEFIGPGATAYLVDTLSATFGDPDELRSAEATVDLVAAARPDVTLSVGEIELSKGPGGGLRAIGVVRNDGGTAARSVVVGVVAIGPDGQAIGAVFDVTDVGDLEPGEAVAFDTEYPGAAPIDGNPLEIIGYAFVPN